MTFHILIPFYYFLTKVVFPTNIHKRAMYPYFKLLTETMSLLMSGRVIIVERLMKHSGAWSGYKV